LYVAVEGIGNPLAGFAEQPPARDNLLGKGDEEELVNGRTRELGQVDGDGRVPLAWARKPCDAGRQPPESTGVGDPIRAQGTCGSIRP
jgi:hypothetical protein